MKRLALLGASGHGKVVADTAECSGWQTVEFFDDAWPQLQNNGHWKVVGDSGALISRITEFDGVVVAIGNNAIRTTKMAELQSAGALLVTLIHPSAIVSNYASIGCGVVIFANVVVNADANVGFGSILNTGCSVDHDCVLGCAVHVSPGAHLAGGVIVGDESWIGIGASVRQLITIGKRVVIGAGAAVVDDIADGLVVAGVPAKRIK